MKKITAIILAAVLAVMAFTFVGCGKKDAQNADDTSNNQSTAQTDTDYVKANGKLVVGITDYEPMNYKDENGQWIGFDTELTKAFCKTLGVEAEFVEIDWDYKFPSLKSKAIDCIWNGMTITDEALKNSSVSDPYLTNSQEVILKASEADKYDDMTKEQAIDALKNLTFAVEAGSAGEAAAKEAGLNVTAVKTQSAALLEVKSGSCDGCIIDKTMADATVGEGTSYSNLDDALTLSTEEFGVSFRQDSDLCAKFNEFVKEYKASGEFQKLADKYDVDVED
ncbi:MAG: transporter substrate-binding domain-containing protein [Clostridia bacterium]|nr:transporter substrate-binding domain-containing protein [Clostridia bacterium]